MKNSEFKVFKEEIIKEKFDGDIMCAGYLFLRLTDKQVAELKALIPKYCDNYEVINGTQYKVKNWIFK